MIINVFDGEYSSLKLRNGRIYAFTYMSPSPISSFDGDIKKFIDDTESQFMGVNETEPESRTLYKSKVELLDFINNNDEMLKNLLVHRS